MKKSVMVGIGILILLISVVLFYLYLKPSEGLDISQNVKEICEIKGNIECISDCQDGFGEVCYFDSNKYSINQADLDLHSLSEEVKNKCSGVHTYAACGNCINDFEIKYESGFEKKSCEIFFQTIENLNQSCGGCIKIALVDCC